MNDPVLSRLSIARKAGLLAVGTEAVKDSILRKKARLVIVASDISAKSEKELRYLCRGEIDVIRIASDIQTTGAAIGLRAGILAVTDEGLAAAVKSNITLEE